MKFTRIALSAAVLLALGACATQQPPPQSLLDATSALQRAQARPDVLANAPLELKKASDTLERANNLQAKNAPAAEISSVAYVAQRQAETAIAVANAKRSDDGIRSAEVDRERARANAREREAAASQNAAQIARIDASVAEQNAAEARRRAQMAEGQATAALVTAAQTQQRNQQLQEQTSNLQAQTVALQSQLNELNAKKTERGMLVTLGDVLFEVNRSEVKPTSLEALRKLADFMGQHPDRNVLIEGFTDSSGSTATNETLSRRRAEAVANALISMGVQSTKLKFVGYGEAYPISANTTEANRAMNRRVEVYISDDQQPVRSRNG